MAITQTPPLPWSGRKPSQIPCAKGKAPRTLLLHIARTAREHEAQVARKILSHHTDMQDKYCGECYDIHPIQSQLSKVAAVGRHHKRGGAALGCATSFVVSSVLAMNKVNIVDIVAVATIFVLHVGNGRSEHV